jgi:hypothetical protein
LKKNLGPKITKDPTRKTACQLHPKTFSSSKMKQASCDSFLKNALSNYLKWSRQMTKFTSDKQEHQTKQKQEGKQKLNLLSLEQELDTNECFSSKNFK